MQCFLAIAELGSLTAAAKRLRVTQPTMSRRLAELEDSVGEPLFTRNAGGTSLTPFGERLLVPALRMAAEAGEVERVASSAEATPRGVVRLSAAPGVAFDVLAPFAGVVRKRLPDVRLEVSSTTAYVDVGRGEADLALRFDRPPRRDLLCLATVTHPIRAYGSRAYAARLPANPSLSDIDWIGWPPALGHLPPNPQLAARVPGWAPVFTSNDFLVQLRAAEAGVGAIILDRGRRKRAPVTPLVDLEVDFGKRVATSYLVCARGSLSVQRVKAVADLLIAELDESR